MIVINFLQEKLSVMDFVDQNITETKPVKPLPLERTPFKLVEKVEDLKDLAAKLRCAEEFAVNFFLSFSPICN